MNAQNLNAHTRKTYEALTQGKAPRDLDWKRFVALWDEVADRVETETDDRLVVHLGGRRVVFHRPHDARVSIEDVEHARELLRSAPTDGGREPDTLVAVAVDAGAARILRFDRSSATVDATSDSVRDTSPVARRLRTVERRSGRDDVAQLDAYFDEIADALLATARTDRFVVLGHGTGKSNVAEAFVARLRHQNAELAQHVIRVVDVDLSAATDAQLQAAALRG